MLIGDEETHTHSRHTEKKAKQRGALESQNSRALLEDRDSKVSAEASSANLGLVSVKKASMVQWPRTVCDKASAGLELVEPVHHQRACWWETKAA